MDNNGRFLRGMLCGVILTLICMGCSLVRYRYELDRRYQSLQSGVPEQETNAALEIDQKAVKKKTKEIQELINAYYLEPVDTGQVEDGIYDGMMESLGDPYSVYYTAEDLNLLEESTTGVYSGIGATLAQDPDTKVIRVVSCFEGTPAYEAELLPGDEVIGFNGEELQDMELSELVSRIKTEQGEEITLSLKRGEEVLEKKLVRREIQVPTVTAEMLEEQIGYIRILEFDEVTEEQFNQKMEELMEQGMEKLIIDVRDNPGGVLQTVCNILDQLLPEGLIVYTEDKAGRRSEYYSDEEHQFDKPLVVLMNENSASAAEIFSGAIKDYGLGTLVGTTTFGKGIVQRIFGLSDGTGIKLTISKYYTPDGNDIHQKGIEPDVEVKLDSEVAAQLGISKEEDNQLQEAIRILKEE